MSSSTVITQGVSVLPQAVAPEGESVDEESDGDGSGEVVGDVVPDGVGSAVLVEVGEGSDVDADGDGDDDVGDAVEDVGDAVGSTYPDAVSHPATVCVFEPTRVRPTTIFGRSVRRAIVIVCAPTDNALSADCVTRPV